MWGGLLSARLGFRGAWRSVTSATWGQTSRLDYVGGGYTGIGPTEPKLGQILLCGGASCSKILCGVCVVYLKRA